MIKVLFLLFFALLSSGVSAAENNTDSSTSVSPVKIGMLLPLSGNYSAIGLDTRHGIEIALSELNSSRLLPVFGDSRTDPSHSINEFRKMVSTDNVLAVFAFRGPIGMAVNSISRQERIALLGGVGNRDFAPNNEYAFQLWPPSDQEGQFVASHVIETGARRIAIVTAQDDWTSSVSDSFRAKLNKESVSIIYDEEFIPSENDFGFTVAKLKRAKPDLVFVNLSLAQIGVFVLKLRQYGVSSQVISNFWIDKPEVLESIGAKKLNGIRFAEISNDFPKLSNELGKRFGSKPSGASISAYVAMMFLGQAAKELGPNPDKKEYFKKLSEVDKIFTVNGDFLVDQRVVQFPLTMRVFRGDVSGDISQGDLS